MIRKKRKETLKELTASIREIRESLREIREKAAEDRRWAEERAEEDRKRAEEDRRKAEERAEAFNRKAEADHAKLTADFDKTERYLNKLSKLYGGMSANIGHAAETYFQRSLAKTMEFGGVQYDQLMKNVKVETRRGNCELDILMINPEAVALVEAKERVHPSLPQEMATRKVTEFRRFFPQYAGHKLYLGIAGMSMDDEVVQEANKYGIGVLIQEGDGIKTLNGAPRAY